MHIRSFQMQDRSALVKLWHACGLVTSTNDPNKDIDRKLATQPELLLVGELAGAVIASVMVGYDGHRGWINYLATSPAHRGQGFGREMMKHAEALLASRGCPKINLQIRAGNEEVRGFYESLGYVVEERISMGKHIEADDQVDL